MAVRRPNVAFVLTIATPPTRSVQRQSSCGWELGETTAYTGQRWLAVLQGTDGDGLPYNDQYTEVAQILDDEIGRQGADRAQRDKLAGFNQLLQQGVGRTITTQ